MDTTQTAPFSLAISEGRRNYLVHFSDMHKYVYVEVPKTGCTTVKRVLQLAELQGDRDRLPERVHERTLSPLLSPAQHAEAFHAAWANQDYLHFTFVRNPYTRILSAYLDKIVTNEWERNLRLPLLGLEPDARIDLIEFLEIIVTHTQDDLDIHWAPQTVLTGIPNNRYDQIYPFEFFVESMEDMLRRLGLTEYIEESRVRTAHATNAHEKLAQYFGPAEIEAVQHLYRDDFAILGYSTDIERALEEPRGMQPPATDGQPTKPFRRPRAAELTQLSVTAATDGATTTTTQYGRFQRAAQTGPRRAEVIGTEEYLEALADEIAREMDGADVRLVTVDVFDTVLVRRATSELRRFYEIATINAQHESRLLDQPVSGVDVLLARLQATHGSYRLSRPVAGCREGVIDQIARVTARSLELSDGAAERLVKRELDYEQRHLTAHPAVVRLLEEIRADGIPVILLSDMYLREVDIRQLLDHAGVMADVELFSSADIRVSKRSGKAFRFVADHAGVGLSSMLHLGDSLYSDFQMARRAGLRAVHLPVPDVERDAIRVDHADVVARLTDQGIDVTRWISSV